MVIDIFSYAGEADILELRLNVLDEYVDQFIIVEATFAFSGHPKPLYYEEQKERFKRWHHKIKYYVVDGEYSPEEVEQARASRYTGGHPRWMLEFLQKEALKKAMVHLQDNDLCYIGDVDEIWEPRPYSTIEKLKLRVYTYYLNLRSTEAFWGPVRCLYGDIKDQCLNDIRNNLEFRTEDYQGWHFTNQGGLDAVRKKVTDQYNEEVFNAEISNELENRFGTQDYIGRDFEFSTDESEWPEFLRENRVKYNYLCK